MSNASLARGVDNKRKPSAVNARHKKVADAIMEGYSDAEAVRAAGYHPSNAKNIIRKEEVQEILAEARGEIEDLSTIKRLDVLNVFLEAIDMARMLSDPSQMINGADKVAKMMGYYAPETRRIELTAGQNVLQAKFQQMTDEELLEIAAGRARVIDGEVLE
jgi:tRNA A37 N6-isopentenylltransferase MiaA